MAEVTGGARLDAALREMAQRIASASVVRVGFFDNKSYPDGTSVATIAALQNFGAPAAGIPPRPFFTHMIQNNSPGWGDKFATVLKANNYDANASLKAMGGGLEAQLIEAIHEETDVPNSPVTILLKSRFPMRDGMTFADVLQARHDVAAGVQPSGSHSQPLVWTGKMLSSVGSEVE